MEQGRTRVTPLQEGASLVIKRMEGSGGVSFPGHRASLESALVVVEGQCIFRTSDSDQVLKQGDSVVVRGTSRDGEGDEYAHQTRLDVVSTHRHVPDVVTLAKATCGGYPGGAIGMSEEIAELVASDTVKQYGTFNGNPLVMAAAKATLTEVLTDDVYKRLEARNQDLLQGCQEIIDRYELPAYTEGMGAKGCVIFSPERLYEYRDYLTKVNEELSTLAWLYHMNHGIFMTPGVEEEWTLSITHTDEDLVRYLDAFEKFADDLSA